MVHVMLYFKKMSKRQNVSIYTHRSKTSFPRGRSRHLPCRLLPTTAVRTTRKEKQSSFSLFLWKKWKIFTIICSFVYVTYVMEEAFIGFPSPPGELKLEPQLKLNRLALEKKENYCFVPIFSSGMGKWKL